MTYKILRVSLLTFLVVIKSIFCSAQDKRTGFPDFLLNKYIGFNIGYLDYFPPESKLEPGYSAGTIRIPRPAVRLVFGHYINKNFSAQISYMRPVDWVLYRNINGDNLQHSVWINEIGFTLIGQIYLAKKLSVYGEGGLGIYTQSGIKINNMTVVKDANYLAPVFGGGLEYHMNKKWNFIASIVSPVHSGSKQPYRLLYSGGFTANIHPPSGKKIKKRSGPSYFFPKNLVQVGYATNAFGYGANNVTEKAYIFWGGDVEVKNGISMYYQHTVYHGRKTFSISLGAGFSYWKSKRNNDDFLTLSVFPVFRFTPVHTKKTDLYFNYCIAGPTFISRVNIDNNDTGNNFTFQDYMGIGAFMGKRKNMNAEIRIAHYSNGDLVPQNGGIKIPLSFNLGYSF
ncbi:MAG: acyloxyacyl hydrolase [Chitinophagales bacterium]